MKEAYIIGAGSYGEAMYELAELCGYKIIGFYDDDEQKIGTMIMGVPVLGKTCQLTPENISDKVFIVAIGNGSLRNKIMELINKCKGITPTLIHPTAEISKYASVGKGVYIQAGVYIWTKVSIDDYTIISPKVVVAHHSSIGKACLVSTGTEIGANISIGDNAFIGMGSTIMTGVHKIGRKVTVGAGATVIKDLPDGCTAVGCPAKIIKTR